MVRSSLVNDCQNMTHAEMMEISDRCYKPYESERNKHHVGSDIKDLDDFYDWLMELDCDAD